MPPASAVWQPPPVKRSTLLTAVVGALALVGTLSGGTSYLGGSSQQEAAQIRLDASIGELERRQEERTRRIEDKLESTGAKQDARMDRIESQIGELKLDVRDLRREKKYVAP